MLAATAEDSSTEPAVRSSPSIGRLGDYLLRDKGALVRVAIWGLASALPALVAGRLVASAVDSAVAGETFTLTLHLAALAASGVVGALSLLALSRSGADTIRRLRLGLTRDVIHATLHREVHDRASRKGVELLQHLPAVLESMAGFLRATLPLALAALGSLLGLATISWVLLATAAPWVLLGLAFQYYYVRTLANRMRDEMTATEVAHAETASVLEAARDLVAANAIQFGIDRVGQRLESSLQASVALAKNRVKGNTVLIVTTIHAPVISALIVTPILLRAGSLSAGEVVGGLMYLVAGLGSATGLTGLLTDIMVTMRVYFARLRDADSDTGQPSREATLVSKVGDTPTLRARGVSFRYGGAAKPIVSAFDLDVRFGESVAIVGPSGVGKSTLAWLLSGLLPPDEGVVTLSDVPLHSMANRHALIAVVPQESYVFHGTLRENLLYLNQDRSDAEIASVIESIGLQRVIDRVGGLDAAVNIEKSSLSEGEQQLIGLARTLLSSASILVLDEATCHLDPHLANHAEQAIRGSGRTVITVAHRMSSVTGADRLVVLEGEHALVGTPGHVRAHSDLFRQFESLWLPQAPDPRRD